jgi:ribosomal protein S18 acetylase RimI-like enzyme
MQKIISAVNLREGRVNDIETFLMLEQKVSGIKTYSPLLTREEVVHEFETNKIFFIEKDGTTVGSISYEQKSLTLAYISGLVVDPEHQGRGIARAALTQLLDRIGDISQIELVTHPENKAAMHIYESLGFKITQRKENYFGDGEPRLVLRKESK